jgi:hypothetical protein
MSEHEKAASAVLLELLRRMDREYRADVERVIALGHAEAGVSKEWRLHPDGVWRAPQEASDG